MENKSAGTLAREVESRLDDLFEESEETVSLPENNGDSEESPLRGLKAIILSVDWEIDDEIMSSLIKEIGRLEEAYKGDKILFFFFRLLASIGKYIKINMADAHPDAIRLLNSVYENLERVVLTKGLAEAEKKSILMGEVNEFKKLQELIALRNVEEDRPKEDAQSEEIEVTVIEQEKEEIIQADLEPTEEKKEDSLQIETSEVPPHEAFIYALEEIKEVIKTEFRALRAELKLWREGQ